MDAPVEGVARVIAIDGDMALLEPEQVNSCGGCMSAASCGVKSGHSRRLTARRFTLANDFDGAVGDRVVVGMSEYALLRASTIAYAIPLLLMVGAAIAGQLSTGSDAVAAIGAVVGLGAGLLLARRRAARLDAKGELKPRFLRFARATDGMECGEE